MRCILGARPYAASVDGCRGGLTQQLGRQHKNARIPDPLIDSIKKDTFEWISEALHRVDLVF